MSRFTTFASDTWGLFVWDDEHWRIQDICDYSSLGWVRQAACIESDPELWFAPEGDLDRAYLSSICQSCPVVDDCLEHALIHNERGWWGGTSRQDRNRSLGRYLKG